MIKSFLYCRLWKSWMVNICMITRFCWWEDLMMKLPIPLRYPLFLLSIPKLSSGLEGRNTCCLITQLLPQSRNMTYSVLCNWSPFLLKSFDDTLIGCYFQEAATVRNKTLFVSGLSRQTKISEMWVGTSNYHFCSRGGVFVRDLYFVLHFFSINFFKDVGEVVHVRLIVFRWGNLHGKGFVEFASANEAMKVRWKECI